MLEVRAAEAAGVTDDKPESAALRTSALMSRTTAAAFETASAPQLLMSCWQDTSRVVAVRLSECAWSVTWSCSIMPSDAEGKSTHGPTGSGGAIGDGTVGGAINEDGGSRGGDKGVGGCGGSGGGEGSGLGKGSHAVNSPWLPSHCSSVNAHSDGPSTVGRQVQRTSDCSIQSGEPTVDG